MAFHAMYKVSNCNARSVSILRCQRSGRNAWKAHAVSVQRSQPLVRAAPGPKPCTPFAKATTRNVHGRRFSCKASAAATSPTEDQRVPVTVITGFLGSGKTTLLNHLLTQNHGRRIAVIENEFGEVDIDSELVAKQELLEGTNDSIMRLTNGCLCCVMRDDLVKVLNKLYRRRSEFDHIVIETTGLANPAPIINTFYMDQELLDRMKLDGVVTVVDAFNVERHLNEVKPADVVNESVEQIAYADRIILNKTDLVSEDGLRQLEDRMKTINEMATVQRAQRGKVEVDYVLGVGGFDLTRIDEQIDAKPSHDHDHDHECGGPDCTHESHSHDHKHDHDHDCAPDCTHESHSHDHNHDHKKEHSHDHEKEHSHAHAHEHSHEHDHECGGADCTHESHTHDKVQQLKHDDKVSSVSLVLEGEFDLDKVNFCLGTLLSERSEDIFRMKGILAIQGLEERFVYHAVHQLFEGAPDRKWRDDEPRINKMVFIGRYLNKEDFEFAFQQCIVKEGPLEVEVLN